jgi:hypothetical protein
MRFLMMTTPDPDAPPAPPSPELYAEMGAFIEESFRNGTLIATGGLEPTVTKIRHKGGQFTMTDGPFTEAKEAVVGFALVEVPSKEEAIALSKRFWRIVGDGEGIIQQVQEPGQAPGQ